MWGRGERAIAVGNVEWKEDIFKAGETWAFLSDWKERIDYVAERQTNWYPEKTREEIQNAGGGTDLGREGHYLECHITEMCVAVETTLEFIGLAVTSPSLTLTTISARYLFSKLHFSAAQTPCVCWMWEGECPRTSQSPPWSLGLTPFLPLTQYLIKHGSHAQDPLHTRPT